MKEMKGAELASKLKSSINFKSLGGQKCEGLKLTKEEMKWWRDAKFGLFIHWGLYSILGRGEWVRHNEQIPYDEYKKLADEFIPKFTPEEIAKHWADAACSAGMKYMVMVARHHDGFSLWDSPGSFEGFTSANTGSKKDYVKAYAEACRNAGMRVGIYYSPMDWRFPGYFHPEELPESAQAMKKQTYDQVSELTTKYGPIDILWYDGGWLAHKGTDCDSAWLYEPIKLNQMVREHNHNTVINPRSGWEGDFYCDEGSHEIKGNIIPVPWEKNMCLCSGNSWGWMPDDPVTPFQDLIVMLVNVICRDGNLLLNVGPDRDGQIPQESVARLKEIGQWMMKNGEAVYGTRGGILQPIDHVYGCTCKDNQLYVHILDGIAFQKLGEYQLPGIPYQVKRASLLDNTPVEFDQTENGIRVQIPEAALQNQEPDTIIRLTCDQPLVIDYEEDISFTGR